MKYLIIIIILIIIIYIQYRNTCKVLMIEICSIKIVITLKICCPCIQTKLWIIIIILIIIMIIIITIIIKSQHYSIYICVCDVGKKNKKYIINFACLLMTSHPHCSKQRNIERYNNKACQSRHCSPIFRYFYL